MGTEILYCDRCSRIVTPTDRQKGLAKVSDAGVVCPDCAKDLPEAERSKYQPGSSIASSRGSTRRRGSSVRLLRVEGRSPSTKSLVMVVSAVAGVLIGITAVVVVVGGIPPKRIDPSPTSSARAVTVAVADMPTRNTTAAHPVEPPVSRLDELSALVGTDPSGYARARELIVAYGDEAAESQRRESARKLLEEIDFRYAGAARQALDSAGAAARAHAERGDYAAARAAIEAIRTRFADGPWLGSAGEALIAEALSFVEKARADAARAALGRASEFLEESEYDVARAELSECDSWPEAQRVEAAAIIKRIEESQRRSAEQLEHMATRDKALTEIHAAGLKGVGEAAAAFDDVGADLRKAGFAELAARIAARLRAAKLLEELSQDALKQSSGVVRLHLRRGVADGRVLSVETGVVNIRSTEGATLTVRWPDVLPRSVVEFSGLLRGDAPDPGCAAAYLMVRGEFEAARTALAQIDGIEADQFAEDINTVEAVVAPPVAHAPEPPEPVSVPEASDRPVGPVEPPTSGDLIGWWKFDENAGDTAFDSSGGGHDAVARELNPVSTGWTGGHSGGAMRFDGVRGCMEVGGDTSAFDLNGREFTIAFWLLKSPDRKADAYVIVRGKTGWPGWGMTDGPAIVFSDHKERQDYIRFATGNNDGSVALGKWHHLAATYEKDSRTVVAYVDGMPVTRRRVEHADMNDIDVPNARLLFGARGPNIRQFLAGTIDDVRIYKRLLSPEEIHAIYELREVAVLKAVGSNAPKPGPPILDLTSTVDRRGSLHVVCERTGALWYNSFGANLTPGTPVLIGTGLSHPDLLVLPGGKAFIAAYEREAKRFVVGSLRSNMSVLLRPARLVGEAPEIWDPYPDLAATSTSVFLFFYGQAGDRSGGLLYLMLPEMKGFVPGGTVGRPSIFREGNRSVFESMADGRAGLLFTDSQFQELVYLERNAKGFDVEQSRVLGANADRRFLTCGAGVDPGTGTVVGCDRQGTLHQLSPDGTMRTWELGLAINQQGKGANRRSLAVAASGEALFVHQNRLYRRSSAGEWELFREASRLQVAMSDVLPRVHYQPRQRRFVIVGSYRGMLAVHTCDPKTFELERLVLLDSESFGQAAATGEEAVVGDRRAPVGMSRDETPIRPLTDLLVNGGFEQYDAPTRFATGWRPHQWGREGASFRVRIDNTNTRSGKRALLVMSRDEAARPGAFTALGASLGPGKYVVQFWACTDVESTADLVISLSGVEAPAVRAGEEWAQFKRVLEIREKLTPTVLRMWSETPLTQLWVDDVSVRREANSPPQSDPQGASPNARDLSRTSALLLSRVA